MSQRKPGQQPGDELNGSIEAKNSKESNPLLARLYHPRTLGVIEQIANLPSTNENDRRRLTEIVARQRALIQENDIDPESINHQLPQTNFEGYVANLLSAEGAIERESLIAHILHRESVATASTIPPSMPQPTLEKVTNKTSSEVDLTLRDAARLQRLQQEVFGKKDDEKSYEGKNKPRYIDVQKDDKFLVVRQKGEIIFPGEVLTVIGVTFENETLVRVENEHGKYFIFDPDSLKQIAKKANPYGNN